MRDLIKRLRSFEYLSLEHICCEAADRIEKLEAAIKEHLLDEGYCDSKGTLEWWVEQYQPFTGVKTAKEKSE